MARPSLAMAFAVILGGVALAAPQGTACDAGTSSYECAVAAVQQQDFSTAIRTLEQVLAPAPRNLKALNLLGIALTGAGRIDDANARFRQALTLDPTFYPARKNLAINEFNRGRLTDAQRELDAVLKQAPDDEIVHVHLAEILVQRKQLAAAIPHYEQARARIGQNPTWMLHYAMCLLARGANDHGGASDRAAAIALLDQLPADDSADRFEAGVALGRAGAHAEAARFFASARAGYKDPYAAAYNQALMLLDAGDHAGAIRVAEELFAQGTKPAELYNLVSQAYEKAGRTKDAYDALREATRIEPRTVEHYVDLASLCLEHENYDLGLEIVDVGLKQRPDASILYLQRGVLFALKGLVEQAEREFQRASETAPNASVPYVALSMAWMQTGQTSKAIDVLRARTTARAAKVRAPKPSASKAGAQDGLLFYVLGMALMRSGAEPTDPAGNEATTAFTTAVRLRPDFAPARAELGKLLLRRDDVPGAIAQLEMALDLDPENAMPAYQLAQAYRKRGADGDVDRARELLARVNTLNARDRGDDPDRDLKRVILRIVRDDAATVSPDEARAAATSSHVVTDTARARFEAGVAFERDGKTREAMEAYQQALRLSPDLVEARYGLSSVCANAGDLDGAIALLRQVIAVEPPLDNARLADAQYNLGVHLWTRAKSSAGPRLAQGLDEAVAALTRAVELDPNQARSQLALGQILAEKQVLAPAIDHLRRAVTLAPDDPDTTYNLGLALRLNGDLDGAETQFRAALARNASHALARRSLGLVLREKGDFAAAATELRASVAQTPDDAQGHHLLGTVLQKLDEGAGAIDEYRQAVRLDPQLIEARVNLAQALARSGRKDEAQVEQTEIARLNTAKADVGRALVLIDSAAGHLRKHDVATAIAQLREATKLRPELAEAHYQLGLALVQQPALTDARAAFQRVLEIEPTHGHARYQLAQVLLKTGDTAQAIRELKQSTTDAPGLIEAQRDLARLAIETKDWPTAATALAAVIAWHPTDAKAHHDLATTFRAQGADDDAARELAIAQRLDPALKK